MATRKAKSLEKQQAFTAFVSSLVEDPSLVTLLEESWDTPQHNKISALIEESLAAQSPPISLRQPLSEFLTWCSHSCKNATILKAISNRTRGRKKKANRRKNEVGVLRFGKPDEDLEEGFGSLNEMLEDKNGARQRLFNKIRARRKELKLKSQQTDPEISLGDSAATAVIVHDKDVEPEAGNACPEGVAHVLNSVDKVV